MNKLLLTLMLFPFSSQASTWMCNSPSHPYQYTLTMAADMNQLIKGAQAETTAALNVTKAGSPVQSLVLHLRNSGEFSTRAHELGIYMYQTALDVFTSNGVKNPPASLAPVGDKKPAFNLGTLWIAGSEITKFRMTMRSTTRITFGNEDASGFNGKDTEIQCVKRN